MSIKPCKSPLHWIGGKAALAKRIIAAMPEHQLYVEVFGGGAHVLCNKPPSSREVYNDRHGELVNLLQCVREPRLRTLMVEYLANVPYSRRQFGIWRQQIGSPKWLLLPPWERAARWFAVLRQAFGGRMAGPSWGFSRAPRPWTPQAFRSASLALRSLSKRLALVQIDDLDFADCIRRYDSPVTHFYCDPPYIACERYYDATQFGETQHRQLAELLHEIQGTAAVSYYPHPMIDELYGDWRRITWEVGPPRVSARHKTRHAATELLLCNYDPPSVDPSPARQ
jgi:DNA adenine methylase